MTEAVATPTNTPATDPALTPPVVPAVPVEAQPLDLNDKVPEVADDTPDEDLIVTYDPTGDVGLDLALAFVGQRGFQPDHPGIVAAHSGDFVPLEKALKAMGAKAKGFETYIAAAKEAHARTVAKGKDLQDAVVTVVGGAENWNAIRAWAQASASDSEKREINAAFQSGKLMATMMAERLALAYQQSGNSNLKPASGVKTGAGAGGSAASANGPLSPDSYKAELGKLHAKYGAKAGNRPEFAELTARRQAYKGN